MPLGPYASFIVTSYLMAAAVVLALICWIIIDYRNQTRRLRDPTLREALLVVGILIVLIFGTVLLFGATAADGPLQVSLLIAALAVAVPGADPGRNGVIDGFTASVGAACVGSDGLAVAEICERTGRSKASVVGLLFRGVQALRGRLDEPSDAARGPAVDHRDAARGE